MSALYIATKNLGKFAEFEAILAGSGWEPRLYQGYRDVAEGRTSYAENAALKARALHAQLQSDGVRGAALGDDSGLEVAALDGGPGVLSARYAGEHATWDRRRTLLLDDLRAKGAEADRSARFVCALHYIEDSGVEIAVAACVDGRIARSASGGAGFGYDPLFFYEPEGRTFAEMPEEEKNRVSHRGRAIHELLERIKRREAGTTAARGM